jgi:hypothetical protein
MFLPVYAAWALFMVAGIDWALDALFAQTEENGWLVAGAALLLPLAALVINLPLVSLHGETSVRDDSEAFLERVPQGAIVYGPFLDVAPFEYLQQVEGKRPDMTVVNSWTLDGDAFLVALAEANAGRRPLFLTQDEPALHGRFQFVRSGTGYEVRVKR